MNYVEVSGYAAACLVFLTFYMKTMVPLRLVGICSNCMFITYGYLGGLYPVLILHAILLPLNCLRLREMLQLIRQVHEVTHGDPDWEWLKPFTSTRRALAGEVLFRKGEIAGEMFIVISGRFRLAESGIEIAPPQLVGELGLLAPGGARTQTLECVAAGTLLRVDYGHVKQLFFQNPKFGFHFLKLITQRLFENMARLEAELARRRPAVTD